MKIIGENSSIEFWKPHLREWVVNSNISADFKLVLHQARDYPHGEFRVIRGRPIIWVWLNPNQMEDSKLVFFHELGHLEQWLVAGKLKHGNDVEEKATAFALSLGCKPTINKWMIIS